MTSSPKVLIAGMFCFLSAGGLFAQPQPVKYAIERSVMTKGYDGKRCWVHARAGTIPPASEAENPRVVLTTQQLQITGSDVFYALHSAGSNDLGKTWSPLVKEDVFARKTIDENIEMTVCDFTPKWHAATKTLLGTGHTVWYQDNKVMKVRPRATAYSVYDSNTNRWQAWKELKMPAHAKF